MLIQFWGHAAHLVSPADRPLMSSLRMAMWVVMPLSPASPAIPSRIHPIGFAGRRDAMSAPIRPRPRG